MRLISDPGSCLGASAPDHSSLPESVRLQRSASPSGSCRAEGLKSVSKGSRVTVRAQGSAVPAMANAIRFEPVPRDRQVEAVRFLNENAFQTPEFMIRPEILRRIEPAGVLDRVQNAQERLMNSLPSPGRLKRLLEQEALDGAAAYLSTDFLSDQRRGVWSELALQAVSVDAYRRNVQRTYMSVVDSTLNRNQPVDDDTRALLRGELGTLEREIQSALPRAADRFSRYHLEDASDQIASILDPKFQRRSGQTTARTRPGLEDASGEPETCWPELVIRPEDR